MNPLVYFKAVIGAVGANVFPSHPIISHCLTYPAALRYSI
jgi:hypothetical protein